MEEKIYCSNCGELIDTDDYGELDGEILCSDCLDDYTTVCDFCGARIWSEDAEGDDYTSLCRQCYHYTRCEECDTLIHNDDAYEYDDGYFCHECYQRIRKNAAIH